MKNLLFALLAFIACSQPVKEAEAPKDLSQQSAKEIWDADVAMNDLAAKEGFNTALLAYADSNLIKPQDNQLPIVGKKALEAHYGGKPGPKEISWAPFKSEAAASGEMGYTLGNWKYVTADTTMFGLYYTMWRKQSDGNWKWTVDGGNNMPSEFIMPK